MRVVRWLPYAALAVADIVTEIRGKRRLAKPLLMPALAATTRPGGAAGVALVASAVGDTALLGTSERAFRCSVGAFAIAHGGWVAACLAHRPRPTVATVTPFAALWLATARRFGPRADGLLLGYGAVLDSMGAMALSTARGMPARRGWMLATGALLFLLSDHLIALDRLADKEIPPGAVMATYTAGQALLASALSEST